MDANLLKVLRKYFAIEFGHFVGDDKKLQKAK